LDWKVFIKLCTAASTLSIAGTATIGPVSAYAASVPLLQPGDQSANVKTLQTDLNAAGYSVGKPDGIFGPGTESVLKKFQTEHHLSADGIVGASTWKALQAAMGPTAAELHGSSIALNGKAVSAPKAFAWQGTTFMPIYYVQQLLKQVNITTHWDGTHWALTTPPDVSPDMTKLPINQQHAGDMDISMNGKVVAYMKGIVFKDPASGVNTTYMPIWYVMQTLKHLQFTTTWDGQNWDLKKPLTYVAYDKTGKPLSPNTTYTSVAAAQVGLMDVPGGTVRDNLGNVVFTEPDFTAYQKNGQGVVGDFTTLPPAEAALQSIPGGMVKDPTGATVFTEPDFTAYQKDGKGVVGDFTTLPSAEAALQSIPGGIVKDSTGTVVFTAPDFVAFISPLGTPTDYTSLSQAQAAIAGHDMAYVVDKQANQVVQGPVNYDYVDNTGEWHNTVSGVIGPAPGFATVGAKYISVTISSGSKPKIYLISRADGTYVGIEQGTYSNPFQTADLRQLAPATVNAAQIDGWLRSNQSPLSGLGQSFVGAQNRYGVNATYLVAHAIEESGWGKSAIAQAKDNLFGYGAYDANPAHDAGMFPSNEYAIRYEAWIVRANYLEPSGAFYDGPTLNGMNVHYATDALWSQHIANLMSQYVSQTGGSASDYKQFSIGMSGAIPEVSEEPVFLVNGAEGSVLNSAYGNLPVYSNPSVGSSQMFPGILQIGNSGQAVRNLQTALLNADVQPDGAFGPLTQSAVKNWQQSHGLPVTGICDLQTWLSLFPEPTTSLTANTTVTINQMKQGMLGNLVTLWYHITAANGMSGWVDSEYISPRVTSGNQSLIDLFRVSASSGQTVSIYGSESANGTPIGTCHNGDDVVTMSMYSIDGPFTPDAQGFVAIKWVNQDTGQAQTGFIQASAVTLTPLTPPTPAYTAGQS